MSFADLTFDSWRRLDHAATSRYAHHIAGQLSGTVTQVETVQHLGAPLQRVVIARGSRNFALVPGGEVTVGFDLEGWQPTPEQLASYRDETLTQGYGLGPDPRAYLALLLSPRRTVTLPAVLMAVENEALTAPPADVPATLAEDGLRVPTPDEWEHACGAGADTLFRWGNHCPLDHSPYRNATGPQQQLSAFGLHIGYDVYQAEMTSDPGCVHGGDGGEAVCGGYGSFLTWLPLATANYNPAMAEFLYGPDGEDMFEQFQVRPVLDLP